MARSIWTGAISFGLVNVPVRMYSATEQKDVAFHEFDEKTGKRIRHKRVVEGGKREVEYSDVAKGYETGKGRYVLLSREELEAADPKRTRTIEISDFVDLDEIDPIYFEKSYYLGPDRAEGSKRAYALLAKALEDIGKVGIAKFVMRSKEYLATVRSAQGVLILETMFFADEVRDPRKSVGEVPRVKVEKRDLDMARRLIDGLATEWDPKRYKDTYRERVLELVRRKSKGQEITVEDEDVGEAPPDLMEALKASVEAVQKRPKTKRRARKAS